MSINWIYLIVGGLFEAVFALSLAKAHSASGKDFALWIVLFLISVTASMWLLFKAMGGESPIAVGTAYAVWGATGAFFTIVAGVVLLNEPTSFWRVFFLATLVLSVVGLQVVSGSN